MSMLRSDANPAFLPDDVGSLVVQPVAAKSVAMGVSTVVDTDASTFRVPIVTADPSAAWTAEGAEITPSDATLAETTTTPSKLAGLTIISAELADDSSPAAAQVVGDGLARDIARQVDAAFFGTSDDDTAPAGLATLTDVTTVDAGAEWTDVDPFIAATYGAELEGATIGAWVTNPDDGALLGQIKEEADSNRPLLQPDPTQPTRRTIGGIPLHTSPSVTPGVVWGIPRDRVLIVRRTNPTLDVDRSAYFSSHRVAVRATLRIGFSFPHARAVQKVQVTPAT